jgi:RecQ-mediated genome instability protein 1
MAPLPRRRVLQIPDSDEDDDNNDDTSVVAAAAATHSSSLPAPAPVAAATVDTEHLFPPPPLVFAAGNETCRAVHEVLARRGLVIKPTYLAVCLQELSTSQPGFANALLERQAEICFAHLLTADFNLVAAGSSLPPSFHLLHAIELPGPFILQVNEISLDETENFYRILSLQTGFCVFFRGSVADSSRMLLQGIFLWISIKHGFACNVYVFVLS